MNFSSPSPSPSREDSFHLKAYNAFDLENRFIAAVRHFKENPLSPLWIILPHLCHQNHWKKVLSEASIPTLNLHFSTPSQLRQKLSPLLDLTLPLPLNREGMRFILEKSCEPLTQTAPVFLPLSRDARPLLRTLDEIENAGVRIQDLDEIPELAHWYPQWESIPLSQWGRANQDELILQTARSLTEKKPTACLWLGLNRQSLAFASLLEATSLIFQKIAVLQLVPEIDEESLQQPWLQQVEKWLPLAQERLPNESIELSEEQPLTPQASFFCAPSLQKESQLILSLIENALSSLPPGEKIGVLIPAGSPLGYAIPLELENKQLPYYSTWSESIPPKEEDLALLALIKIQINEIESPDFIHFLETHRDQPLLWEIVQTSSNQIAEIREHLYRSFQKNLSTHLEEASPHPAIARFQKFYQANLLYPEEFSIIEGIELTVSHVEKLCGLEVSVPLQQYLNDSLLDLHSVWKKQLSKKEYLTLLQRLLQSSEQKPIGDPWASIWILQPEEATPLTWHTLLFTQLNESIWPSLQESGVSLLNDEARSQLNHRLSHHPHFHPLITLSSRYQIERAKFETLITSVRVRCDFTASARSELNSGEELYPSEFYRQAWNRFQPQTPWKESFWTALTQQSPPSLPPPVPEKLAQQFELLHSRYDPEIPFNEFLFCHHKERSSAPPLSATQAERILKDPASAWFEIYLEVQPPPESWKSREVLGLIQGNRLHTWIADSFRAIASSEEFNPLPSWEKWNLSLQKILDQAQQKQFTAPHTPLWWKHHFPALQWRAQKLLENLYQTLAQLPDAHIACEYRLQRPMIQPLPEFPSDQEWIGRLDWLAINDSTWEKSKKIWILDLKTGNGSTPFHQGTLLQKADYFQLLVYAGLAQAQHPLHPEISVGVILPKWSPPVEMTPLSAFDPEFQPLWSRLSKAWREGIFGQSHEIHQRFSTLKNLPLATTPISQEILDAKSLL